MLYDLAVTPIAEVIRRISSERRSGDLEVRQEKTTKIVFFDRGSLVFAASNLKEDRLGESLVSIGRITDEEFRRASALMRRGSRRKHFGEALVQAGVMDKAELGGSVARQVSRIVLSLFKLREGAASFDERPTSIPVEYMVSLSIHRLLYVGIRSMPNRKLALVGLGDLDRTVVLAPTPPFRFAVYKAPAGELAILEQTREPVALKQLVSITGGVSEARARAVYALYASGILQDAEPPESGEVAQPVVHMETETFLLSPQQRAPDRPRREGLRKEIDQQLEYSDRLDREAWLRLASRDEILRALEDKMARYSAVLDGVHEDPELKHDIELVLGRTAALHHWARKLQADAGEPPPPVAPKPKKDTDTQPLRPVRGMAAEEEFEVPMSELLDAAEEPPAASQGPAVPTPSAPKAKPKPKSARALEIERLVKDGDLRMQIKDYGSATQTYGRLVELAPTVAAHRLRLAIAMTCWPPTTKQAEREFLEAVRLEPNNAKIHYEFGRYYRAMKLRSRALAELRTAVSLDPANERARGELQELSPKDPLLQPLKNAR
jgi:tetratricopeptide (TPR) repeat protein